MSKGLALVNATIEGRSIELRYADSRDLDTAANLIHIRVPIETDRELSLAFHYLQALHVVREALAAEIQTLTHIVNQNDETMRLHEIKAKRNPSA